jgi:hypothetical protein
MTLERFKDYTAIAQNLLIAAAVVIGGLWTVYVFEALQTRKKAEQELFAQAILDVEVKAGQLEMDDQGGLYIAAMATIKNNGKRTGNIDLKLTPPFRISKIAFSDTPDGGGRLDQSITARNVTRVDTSAIASGSFDQFHMFVRVPDPGHYYVEFRAALMPADLADDKDIVVPKEPIFWWGATSVQVEKPKPRVSQR